MEQIKYQSTKNKRWIIFCSVALVTAIIATAALFLHDMSKYHLSAVTGISANVKSEEEIVVKLHYILPSGGYSVREVPEDEGEYIGDGMIDYDGSIGKYRLIVSFGDIAPHERIVNNLAPDRSFTLMDSPIELRVKIAYPTDHGFVLYIGSDAPIHVENLEHGELNALGGTIRIPITVDGENE